jgi:hypothetical protein
MVKQSRTCALSCRISEWHISLINCNFRIFVKTLNKKLVSICNFKIFVKILNKKLVPICDRLLACNQTAFVKGRFILECVVSAHKILQEDVKQNTKGLVLKLDYEKAYDRVNLHFREEMMSTRGFCSKWRTWVMNLVKKMSLLLSG